jgi:hypothetical protein
MTLSISSIEVLPVIDKGDCAFIAGADDDADFFGLFGWVEGEVNGFYIAIGDFAQRCDAELVKELLDNKSKGIPPKQ